MTKIAGFLCLLLIPLSAAQAATRALLIGVSEYPSLPASIQLRGPRRDVPVWRDWLIERGLARNNIRVLADGVGGGALPTGQAIRDALRLAAAEAQPGDYWLLMLAGHGSRQPRFSASELPAMGYEGIFLPRDIGRWDGSVAAVRNALSATELSAALGAIRDKGAFVWAVFDTCYAGSLMRGETGGETRWRYVDPTLLGVPEAGAAWRGQSGAGASPLGPLLSEPEGQVAFFAAQDFEATPELKIDGDWHSLFAHGLLRFLREQPQVSYRALMDQLAQRYRKEGREQGPRPYLRAGLAQYLPVLQSPRPLWPTLSLVADPDCETGAPAGWADPYRRTLSALTGQVDWSEQTPAADLRLCPGASGARLRLGAVGSSFAASAELAPAELVPALQSLLPLLRLMKAPAPMPAGGAAGLTLTVTDDRGRRLPPASRLHPGQRLRLELRNRTAVPRDLALIHVDATLSSSLLYPLSSERGRIEAGGARSLRLRIDERLPGRENLLLVSLPAPPDGAPTDLRFLVEPLRGDEPAGRALLLYAEVQQFSWETIP